MDAITQTRPGTTSAGTTTGRSTAITSDFTTFLRMLTTQLQNQDPLNPMDSSDYAVQLATFSGVEQQVRTNGLLTDLAQRFDLLGMAQLSGWVGQEALSTAPVAFGGTPITLQPDPATGADSAVLVVTESSGTLVSRETIPADGKPYLWLGADTAGNLLPAGNYTLTLESQRAGKVIDTSPVASYARIDEARRGDGGIMLRLATGQEVAAKDILGLRKP